MNDKDKTVNNVIGEFLKGSVDLYKGSKALFKGLGLTVWGGLKIVDSFAMTSGLLSSFLINIPLSIFIGGEFAAIEYFKGEGFDLGKISRVYLTFQKAVIDYPWIARMYGYPTLAIGLLGLAKKI